MKLNWIKLDEQLPPNNTLVLVKRVSNKVEDEPIYFAMREDKELSTDIDASRNCYWHGNNKKHILGKQESPRLLDGFANFSDVTVKEWCYIDFI